MKIDWKRKLSSRKFWAAVAAWATSLLTAFNIADSVIARVAALISGIGALAIYTLAEAYTDGKKACADVAIKEAVCAEDMVVENCGDRTLFSIIGNLYADCDRLREIEQKYLTITEEKEVRTDIN